MSTHPLLIAERKKMKNTENKVILYAVICFKLYMMFFGITAAFAIKDSKTTISLTQR